MNLENLKNSQWSRNLNFWPLMSTPEKTLWWARSAHCRDSLPPWSGLLLPKTPRKCERIVRNIKNLSLFKSYFHIKYYCNFWLFNWKSEHFTKAQKIILDKIDNLTTKFDDETEKEAPAKELNDLTNEIAQLKARFKFTNNHII